MTGRMRYIDPKPFSGMGIFNGTIDSDGSKMYNITFEKNSLTIPEETGDIDIPTKPTQISLGFEVLEFGDEIEPQIKVDSGNTDNITPTEVFWSFE